MYENVSTVIIIVNYSTRSNYMAKINKIDKILDMPKRNFITEPKPISSNWWILLVVPLLYFLLIYANYFTENQAIILGIVGSTVTALLILLTTLNNEKRMDFLSARKSARILSEVLSSIHNQIEQIENGSLHPIDYPDNWLTLYVNCSIYLQYDYLQYLLLEFDTVKKINNCINRGNEAELTKLLNYRKKSITDDWTNDYNIITLRPNLLSLAFGWKEYKPWKQEKTYIEFADFFRENYTEKVKELTIEHLNKHGGSCKVNYVDQYVMEQLRQNEAALRTGKYKYQAFDNKAMLYSIFKVFLSLNSDDKIELCWGELSLKN